MKIISTRMLLLGCLLCVGATQVLAQSNTVGVEEKARGFMFSFGAGAAQVYYGSESEAVLAQAVAMGLERTEISLDVSAGFALGRDIYAVGSINAFATRLSDIHGDYAQLNYYLYGGGFRVYPFHTGLVLGVDGGLARVVAMSSGAGDSTSPAGWGAAVSAAWDFNSKATGFSLVAGLRAYYDEIEGWTAYAVSAFADLAWK